jgi:hypothetical protein
MIYQEDYMKVLSILFTLMLSASVMACGGDKKTSSMEDSSDTQTVASADE